MHALDLDATLVNDEEGSHYLANEFFYRGDNENIVFEPKEEDNQGGSQEVLDFRRILELDGKQAGNHKTGKDAKPAQRWDGRLVYFTLIGNIEQLLTVCNSNNSRNCQKSDGKGNRYSQ